MDSPDGGELGSTGLLKTEVACRGWSAGLVKSGPNYKCQNKHSFTSPRCLSSDEAPQHDFGPRVMFGDANSGWPENNRRLPLW